MFKASSQLGKFSLLILLSSLMPSSSLVIAQDGSESYSIVPTPEQSLVLDVEFDDRPYVVGEPVWIRCSLINITPDPVKIFYGLEKHKFLLDVGDPQGEVVPRIVLREIDYAGPEIVTIDPGHRLVSVISLLDEYYVKEPGEYQVTVRYESSGESVQRDKTNALVTLKATPCNLQKKLSGVRIVNSKQKIDQDAAEFLIGKGGRADGVVGQVTSFSMMMSNRSKQEGLIRDYGESRLADYARYQAAKVSLQRFGQTINADFAKTVLAQLEAIDTSDYPELFQEYVHFRLIEAQRGALSSAKEIDLLIKKFRELYPNSPLLSP